MDVKSKWGKHSWEQTAWLILLIVHTYDTMSSMAVRDLRVADLDAENMNQIDSRSADTRLYETDGDQEING